jgi:hypothetical protein
MLNVLEISPSLVPSPLSASIFALNQKLASPMLYRGYAAQTTGNDTAKTLAAQRVFQVALA